MATRLDVSELWIYPVKSCRGVAVERAAVTPRGFAGDRRYMVVDETGQFVTQRDEPRLARVALAIGAEAFELSAPGARPFELPREIGAGERFRVRVWSSTLDALEHEPASRWFSDLFGRNLRVVFMPDSSRRQVDLRYAEPGEIVSFADGFPLLLIGQGSLDELNRRLPAPIEMRRFRPSLVVSGGLAHAEDEWKRVRVAGLELKLVKPCGRCVVTTRDPETGEAGVEPLTTLSRYRTRDGHVDFGMNAIPVGTGVVERGAPVELVV